MRLQLLCAAQRIEQCFWMFLALPHFQQMILRPYSTPFHPPPGWQFFVQQRVAQKKHENHDGCAPLKILNRCPWTFWVTGFLFMTSNRLPESRVNKSHMLHGAGTFANIYQDLPPKWPSFVGQYSSTMVRICIYHRFPIDVPQFPIDFPYFSHSSH